MATTVELQVNAQVAKALSDLDKVQAKVDVLQKASPIDIKINISADKLQNVTKEMIQLAKAQADEAKYNAKKATEEEKTARARIVHARAIKEATDATDKNTDANKKNADSFGEVGNAASKTSALVSNFAATLMHRLANSAINAIRDGFREALTTMREVDQELANIQKVTDESDAAIAKVGDTAYDTASKYGVAANEYLESAAAFAKAGYDNYTQMAELATKTQLVGDVNAEVATKFLLSADAAFKFGGDMEKLSSTLDKANIIENNYATSIEKLAQGFPLVAATASMANMTVDETLAAIGTITAKTQESGTMAARALRALILNILGDTQTEIEDGVTWTEAELKTMNGLLWKYAEEPMRKAQAAGTVVNPMEAIKALHEAYETGVLTQKELTDIAMDLGGKLRTNQLLALIQNYDTFTEMLGKTADSAGSADREIDVMLGTWNAKVNQLKNSWTELVANFVSTDAIKGGVDALRGLVDGLNDAFDKATIEDYATEIAALEAKGEAINSFEAVRLEYLKQQTAELAKQNEEELKRWEWLHAGEAGGEVEALQSMVSNAEAELFRTGDIEAYQETLAKITENYQDYYDILQSVSDAGISLTADQEALISVLDEISAAASASEDEIAIAATQHLDELNQANGDAATSAEEIGEAAAGISFDGATQSANGLLGVLQSIAAYVGNIGNYSGGLGQMATGGISGGGPTLVNELGPELISQNGKAFIANGGQPAVVNLSRGAIVLTARQTENALRGGRPIQAAARGLNLFDYANTVSTVGGNYGQYIPPQTSAIATAATVASTAASTVGGLTASIASSSHAGAFGGPEDAQLMAALEAEWEAAQAPKRKPSAKPKSSGGGGGGGSSVPAKTVEELAKETKDLLSNLDKQAKLANNQGDYAKEAQIYEQAQEAIKKMVDDYRKAGYKDDSDEILDLLNKNYDYANKQLNLYQTKWDELIKALEADTDAQELANKLAEKQQAVEDAREALASAQKQRTIRMYNSATGQWEWVADQDKINSAQQKLTSAEEGYADEVKSQAIKELEAMRDTVTDLNDVILGPALSKVAMMAENSNEFQNFARALNAVYGVGSFMQSTEGTTKAISTADSHDTVYTFGNVTLTEEQASSMSVAELAKKLQVLKIS